MKERICFIDAAIFVHAFDDKDPAKHKNSQQLIVDISQGTVEAVTDALALAEAFHVLELVKGRETARAAVRDLLSVANLRVVEVGANILFEALRRCQKYELRVNDLIHYTVAMMNSAAAIYSYDKDFDGLEIERTEP